MDQDKKLEKATFAGGCFWCMEPPFENLTGISEVVPGYTGGQKENPTYEEVSGGTTGHVEAVQIIYDPNKISYQELLNVFWQQIDPTDDGGQFVDRGAQYRTAIFYHDEEQKRLAEESKRALEKSGPVKKPIATKIIKFTNFHRAEDYHQDYYQKEPIRYRMYKLFSGRDQFLHRTWDNKKDHPPINHEAQMKKPPVEELRKRLTPLQYKVTQENATEAPFDNEYCNNKKDGIYVNIISGEPLFSSKDKFDAGCGWPSFTTSLASQNFVEKIDSSHGLIRTEVRSKNSDSHLGHVFTDGPAPTGLRYCINSAALRFIPVEDLEKEGYGAYKKLFGR